MAKLLLIVVVFALVYFVVKFYVRSVSRKRGDAAPAAPGEDMVQCTHCGVHLPRSESIGAEGRYFCSQEHQRLGGRRG